MEIHATRLWLHQTVKRLGPRLTSVVPGPGRSRRSTGWRHSSSPCKSRRYTDHSRLSPYYSPPGQYSRSPQRLRYPSWESSSHICHFPHRSLSNTCPCRLLEYSFYSHPQCPCMSNTSKLLLIKKKRNKKTSSKHVDTNFTILISFINILISLIVCRPMGSFLEAHGNVYNIDSILKLGWLPMKERREWHFLKAAHKAIYSRDWPRNLQLEQEVKQALLEVYGHQVP